MPLFVTLVATLNSFDKMHMYALLHCIKKLLMRQHELVECASTRSGQGSINHIIIMIYKRATPRTLAVLVLPRSILLILSTINVFVIVTCHLEIRKHFQLVQSFAFYL